MNTDPIDILIAEDDPEDQELVTKAFASARVLNRLTFVHNGEELLDYLRNRPPFQNAAPPDLILLDLSMPRMDGREALEIMKRDPELKHIPVVILTTSDAEQDIVQSYRLGASSYIQKPVTFAKLVDVVNTLGTYWVGIVKLPTQNDNEVRLAT